MLARIAQTIRRYNMFPAPEIGVAVSGGADSVCLLHALLELAPEFDLRLTVLHLDHGLRPESAADADFVRELADGFHLPFQLRTTDFAGAHGNLEQAARRARLAFFDETIASGAVQRVATGHTRSDQAETVLFRFLRGSGGAGLAAIRPVTTEGIVRPLIDIERVEVLQYLRARNLPWREDSTNASPDFARNRIRHGLLPELARDWNPGIVQTLAHTADWAQAEEAWWHSEIDRLAKELFRVEEGAVLVSAGALGHLPLAPARRLVRRAIELIRGDLRGVAFSHVDAVLALAARPRGGSAQLPGVSVRRSFDSVRFGRRTPRSCWRLTPAVPGLTPIPGANLALSLEIVEKSETLGTSHCVYNSEMGCLDWERLSGSPTVRNWQPGDRYQPMGNPGEAKLKNLFQEARVPVWERADWPVLEVGERIVWSRRFGPAVWCAAEPGTPVILQVREVMR